MADQHPDLPARLIHAAALQLGDKELVQRYHEEWSASLPLRGRCARWRYALSLFLYGSWATRRQIRCARSAPLKPVAKTWCDMALLVAIAFPSMLLPTTSARFLPLIVISGGAAFISCLLMLPFLLKRYPPPQIVLFGLVFGVTSVWHPMLPAILGWMFSAPALVLGCLLVLGLGEVLPRIDGGLVRLIYCVAAAALIGQLTASAVGDAVDGMRMLDEVSGMPTTVLTELAYCSVVAAPLYKTTRWAALIGLAGGMMLGIFEWGSAPAAFYLSTASLGAVTACAVALSHTRRVPRTLKALGFLSIFALATSGVLAPCYELVSPLRWFAHHSDLTKVHEWLYILMNGQSSDNGWRSWVSNGLGWLVDQDLVYRILALVLVALTVLLTRAIWTAVSLLRTTGWPAKGLS